MSPYQQGVIDETLRQYDQSRVAGRQDIQDAAVQAGAFGGGREGAFSGLTYRDFAGALGNRGLRVGDSLNANDVMSRLQGIRQDNFNRQQGMPVASSGAGLPQLGIQNRRGRDVNRGSLSNMQQGIRNRAANRPAPGGLKMKQMSSPMTSGGSNRLPGPSNDFPY